ncbi:WAT1-related protein [Senna tora]|uniref:WAT1-related protein n=1 Tax=Senna tora TaxID=362788 RepID=A0A834SMK5_9FABA|nr:WAT1-related protein [Senna tora]
MGMGSNNESIEIWKVVDGVKPTMLMVMVQFSFAGVNILYKLAVNDGMSLRVIAAYRFIFATAFIAPLAFFLERKKRPKMTRTILFQAFLCGLFGGALSQNFYLEALALTSATFASAMSNLIPAITFIMALCFRLERANLQTAAGKAKVIGTITGIGGAMTLTFFKGIQIHTPSFHVSLLHHPHDAHVASPYSSSASHTLLGALCALCSCFSYALWLIIQTKMSEKYPSHYTSTALMSGMGSLLSIGFALSLERDWAQWNDFMVRTHERASFCVGFQPTDAGDSGGCWMCDAGGEAISWNYNWRSVDSVWIVRGFMGKRGRDEEEESTSAITHTPRDHRQISTTRSKSTTKFITINYCK